MKKEDKNIEINQKKEIKVQMKVIYLDLVQDVHLNKDLKIYLTIYIMMLNYKHKKDNLYYQQVKKK